VVRQDDIWTAGAQGDDGAQRLPPWYRRRQDDGWTSLDHFGRSKSLRKINAYDGPRAWVRNEGQEQALLRKSIRRKQCDEHTASCRSLKPRPKHCRSAHPAPPASGGAFCGVWNEIHG
jgi:hypothetical protein